MDIIPAVISPRGIFLVHIHFLVLCAAVQCFRNVKSDNFAGLSLQKEHFNILPPTHHFGETRHYIRSFGTSVSNFRNGESLFWFLVICLRETIFLFIRFLILRHTAGRSTVVYEFFLSEMNAFAPKFFLSSLILYAFSWRPVLFAVNYLIHHATFRYSRDFHYIRVVCQVFNKRLNG